MRSEKAESMGDGVDENDDLKKMNVNNKRNDKKPTARKAKSRRTRSGSKKLSRTSISHAVK